MGYQITFKPTQEAVDKLLKPFASRSADTDTEIHDIKLEIAMYCMKAPEEKSVISSLRFRLKWLYEIIKQSVYSDAVSEYEKEGEVWYCGWAYSKDECEWDLDEMLNISIKNLILCKDLIPTPDWFANSDNFYAKLGEIESTIDGFEEACLEIVRYEVINKLREFDIDATPDEEEKLPDPPEDSDPYPIVK